MCEASGGPLSFAPSVPPVAKPPAPQSACPPSGRSRKSGSAPTFDLNVELYRILHCGAPLSTKALAFALPALVGRTRCGLASFMKECLMPPAEPPPRAGADPWPCPPPLPLPVAGASSSDPTSSADERRAARELVRYAVAALNWETLGFPASCPLRCRASVPASKVQQAHLDRLQTLAMSAVRLGSSDPGELSRSLDKFQWHHDA